MSKEDEVSGKILSDIVVFNKYAKYDPILKRRETWEEICIRNMNMHTKKFPQLENEIVSLYNQYVITKKVLPSMRSLQFAGKPIELSPNRMFNCCFLPMDNIHCFNEIMFLLLGGTGVGYSVQRDHVEKLPEIKHPTKKRRYLIQDSIYGWADAVKALVKAYFCGSSLPVFDFSDIREKGAMLVTSGGKAPGPQPLKDCLHNLMKVLDSKKDGNKLTSLEVHDMVCYIADAVLAGGIRRAACSCLFNIDDNEMLTCKFGAWWEQNPQRARANNSAVVLRHKVDKNTFLNLWEKIEASGSGEPGIFFSNNADWGTNPCFEIALRPYQFCNLTTINVNKVSSQVELEDLAKAAAFLGTLQASYTDFYYLRDIWKRTTEKDALIGVSMTGIASGAVLPYNLESVAQKVKEENARVASILGINPASRTTCIKPEGTASLVLGTSSGIHAWHSPFYYRRMRVGKNEAIYEYLSVNNPELVEDDFFNPSVQAIVTVPIKAPSSSIFRTESALDLLERVKRFSREWIIPGHIKGDNTHNVSATISVKPNEWKEVGEWMWNNREHYSGLAVLPYDGGNYKQAPFEECTEEEFNQLYSKLKDVDLTKIIEEKDDTNLTAELACAGGVCEIK